VRKFKFITKDKISQLPKNPGVYAFKKDARLLYIGKATNLKERIKNHFPPVKYREAVILPKAKLFNRVKQIGYIKTNSEIEALILEANLIKKYQPKYNVVWRDDKNYFFVGITKEYFPRVFITHQPKLQTTNYKLQTNYVGPFVDGKALKQTLKVLRKVFPYRSCRVIPKRACLWYHLGRCPAPCLLRSKILEVPEIRKSLKKEIQRNANSLFEIVRGRKSRVLRELKKEMKAASLSQDFEKATKIRDQISALEKVLAHAKVFEEFYLTQKINWLQIQKILQQISKTKKSVARIEAYDVSNIQGQEATGAMVTFINGLPDKNFYRKFKIKITGKPNDVAMLKEVLSRRLKHSEWPYPDLMLIDGGRAQLNAALRCLTPGVKHLEMIALAKRKNELFIRGQKEPILLKNLPREIFNLILQLRDEAHRFAISYHKKLRAKALMEK